MLYLLGNTTVNNTINLSSLFFSNKTRKIINNKHKKCQKKDNAASYSEKDIKGSASGGVKTSLDWIVMEHFFEYMNIMLLSKSLGGNRNKNIKENSLQS